MKQRMIPLRLGFAGWFGLPGAQTRSTLLRSHAFSFHFPRLPPSSFLSITSLTPLSAQGIFVASMSRVAAWC